MLVNKYLSDCSVVSRYSGHPTAWISKESYIVSRRDKRFISSQVQAAPVSYLRDNLGLFLESTALRHGSHIPLPRVDVEFE